MLKTKSQIKKFAEESEENIQTIAANPCLKQVASMCNGKGLPDKAKVEAFIHWLPSDERKRHLKLACRIFERFGLPSVEKLTDNEKTLRQCLKQYGYTTEHGDDNSDEEDELLESSQMKALALYFSSASAKWNMTVTEFQQYLTAHKSPRNDRVLVRAALKSLLPILAIHGGSGTRFWIEMHSKNPRCNEVLTKALSIPTPLALTKLGVAPLLRRTGVHIFVIVPGLGTGFMELPVTFPITAGIDGS